jgi:hypothetical protein
VGRSSFWPRSFSLVSGALYGRFSFLDIFAEFLNCEVARRVSCLQDCSHINSICLLKRRNKAQNTEIFRDPATFEY